MKTRPKVSTITPCYKMGKYLEKFLEELPKQTYFDNLEVVLDHNMPSDEELELVADFQGRHPGKLKHVVTRPLAPIGTSMNTCIENATGEYLAIWNVDDLRTPDSIELLVNNMEEGNDVSFGNFIIVNQFGNTHGKVVDLLFLTYAPMELERGMCIGPFFMFRKSLLEKSGMFDEQYRSGADFDFAVRLAKNGKVGFVNEFIGYYLDEGKGASTRGDGLQPLERTAIEMRYGIDDKVVQALVPKVKEAGYDMENITVGGVKIPVEKYLGNK